MRSNAPTLPQPALGASRSPLPPPTHPAGQGAREAVLGPRFLLAGSHPSPNPWRDGKLLPRVGTCAELQAGAVAARAVAARGGCRRARAVPDDGGER